MRRLFTRAQALKAQCCHARALAPSHPPPPWRIWMHLVNGTGNSPSPGQPTLE